MKKKIDLMTQILRKKNLGDQILEGAKKKPKDHDPKGSHHASWIVDSGASHHMDTT